MANECGGCRYHKFPYTATVPVRNEFGELEEKRFESLEDVWNIIDLIIKESTEQANSTGFKLDIDKAITSQLSFFCCPNVFYNREIKADIERYFYCLENNVPAFKGSYGDQPARWVDKFFVIKNAYAKKENMIIEENRKKQQAGLDKGFKNG